ncbi:kelch repeat and BTB domain-containing protein 12 [Tetranychus urticae]|uniref:kelch repeat and BTB domain-containing protein 12 n=1 Tax=Tetranychus urticae TaxID=32264 RepID=UPI00077BEE99|nr:kelch repeat and BTB domain-containing protein 12 [Tetranychus urticae]
MEAKKDIQQNITSSFLISAYKSGKCSDVTVVMNGDEEYRVHKLVLSASIPYFDKMFSSGLSESTSEVIKLDHPPIIFDLIIEWAYCLKISITKANAVDLFHLADYMNITELTSECLNFLWNEFCDSPLIDIDYWMNKINTEETREINDKYICSNFWDIIHTDLFPKYNVETVNHMISLNELHIDHELQVFEAIIKWGDCVHFCDDDITIDTFMSKLLKKVRWVDIDVYEFMKRAEKVWWFEPCNEDRPVIMAALELSLYKSLEQVKISGLNFDCRGRARYIYHFIKWISDSNIKVEHRGDYKDISFSLTKDSDLSAPKFGDLSITEHEIEYDCAVIRIDWRNKTYRLFKNETSEYILMFDRLFQFNKQDKKIYLWKGDRQIELAPIIEELANVFTVVGREGFFYFTSIVDEPDRQNDYSESNQPKQMKLKFLITKFNPIAISWEIVGNFAIAIKRPIRGLKSRNKYDSMEIYLDGLEIFTYYFDSKKFKEPHYSNYLKAEKTTFRSLVFENRKSLWTSLEQEFYASK